MLPNRVLSSMTQDEVFKAIWKLKMPSKVSIFAWRLIQDRLPTRNNLRRCVEINDASCPFCRNHEEEILWGHSQKSRKTISFNFLIVILMVLGVKDGRVGGLPSLGVFGIIGIGLYS